MIIAIIAIYHASQHMIALGVNTRPVGDLIFPLISTGMGLFFLISGMNSTRYICGTWRTVWRKRLGPLLYLLVVWIFIYWLFFDLLVNRGYLDPEKAAFDLIYDFITPSWELWFLWSLAAYIALSRIIQTVPSLYVTALFGSIAFIGLCTSDWHLRKYGLSWIADHYNWRGFICYFFFFDCGSRFANQIKKMSSFPLIPVSIILIAVSQLAQGMDGYIPSIFVNAPLHLIELITALMLAICMGRILGKISLIRNVGAATLPVYLLHPIILMSIMHLPGVKTYLLSNFSVFLSPIVGIASVILSLAFSKIVVTVGGNWLFKVPSPLTTLHDYFFDRRPFVRWQRRAAHVD